MITASPQLFNRTELGKSQPIETYHVADDGADEFDGSPSKDPGWQPPQASLTVAIHQSGYGELEHEIQERMARLKKAMAFP